MDSRAKVQVNERITIKALNSPKLIANKEKKILG
jgi:hypothetical protein